MDEKNITHDEIIDKVQDAISETVQIGILGVMTKAPEQEKGPQAIRLACNAALSSIIPIAGFLAKRPDINPEEAKAQAKNLLPKMICRDTLLWAALIAVRMHQSVTVI